MTCPQEQILTLYHIMVGNVGWFAADDGVSPHQKQTTQKHCWNGKEWQSGSKCLVFYLFIILYQLANPTLSSFYHVLH